MDKKFQAWKITEFNLQEQINLADKFGLIKIYRSDDGVLILVGDADYGLIDQNKPSPASFLRSDSILGFVLDIGIQREKMLTYGHGYYFGTELAQIQSKRPISQKDFDQNVFDKIGSLINTYYQSGDKHKEIEAIKIQLLFDTYNDARLLFPTFYAESYLSLMRILDSISHAKGRYDFATFIALISADLNNNICDKLKAVKTYKNRLIVAIDLFNDCLKKAKDKKWSCYKDMEKFDDSSKVIFSCFYSAYQYRNKFVHNGFPFPVTVKESWGLEDGSGTAYLNPALGISWSKNNRPNGLEKGDSIDVHEIVGAEMAEDFKNKYFQLLPTWHFLKSLTREALLKKVADLIK
jgi:hypothetical protein